MEYKFTFIDVDGQEETTVCPGHNVMDALWNFYDLEGMRNILLVELNNTFKIEAEIGALNTGS